MEKNIRLISWSGMGRVFFNSNVFPLILVFAFLGILFVCFAWNGLEIEYKITSVDKDIAKSNLENRELKAKKAKLLSARRLRHFAKKYELQQPKQKQIIVVP